ncbi:MAG: hypothetical protein V1928_03610 [Parcubacteria group bacterium]
MKKFVVVLFVAAFAFVCLAMSGCENKNASKRKAEFVSGGAENIQPKARPEFLMQKASAAQAQNRMPPFCGGIPATVSKSEAGMKGAKPVFLKNDKPGRGKVETRKVKGSV